MVEKNKNEIRSDEIQKAIIYGEKYINVLEENIHQEALLLAGFTGAGKSTQAALLYGCTLMSYDTGGGIFKLQKSTQSKIDYPGGDKFIIQHKYQSGTEIPVILKDQKNNFFYVDMPGIYDNKGITQEIINGFYIYRVFQTHKKVKILFVVTQASLYENRADTFLKSVQNLSITFKKVNYHNCIGMLVTQADSSLTSEKIANQIKINILGAEELGITPEAKSFCQYLVNRVDLITIMNMPPQKQSNDLDEYYSDFKQIQYQAISKLEAMKEPTIYTSVSKEAKDALQHFIVTVKESYEVAADCFINDIGIFIGNKLSCKFIFDDKGSLTQEQNEQQLQQIQILIEFFCSLENLAFKNFDEMKENVSKNVQKINFIIEKCLQYQQHKLDISKLEQIKNQIILMEYFKTIYPEINVDEIVLKVFDKLSQKCQDFKKQHNIMQNQLLDYFNFCALSQFDKLCTNFSESVYSKTWKKNAYTFLQFLFSISQKKSFDDFCDQIIKNQPEDFKINFLCLIQLKEVIKQCNQHVGNDQLNEILPVLKNKLRDSQLNELKLKKLQIVDERQEEIIILNNDNYPENYSDNKNEKTIIESLKKKNDELNTKLKNYSDTLEKFESDQKQILLKDQKIEEVIKKIKQIKDSEEVHVGCQIF